MPQYAGFWSRVGAGLIDFLVVTLPLMGLHRWLSTSREGKLVSTVMLPILVTAYNIYFHGRWVPRPLGADDRQDGDEDPGGIAGRQPDHLAGGVPPSLGRCPLHPSEYCCLEPGGALSTARDVWFHRLAAANRNAHCRSADMGPVGGAPAHHLVLE